jgi:hypothetical protein
MSKVEQLATAVQEGERVPDLAVASKAKTAGKSLHQPKYLPANIIATSHASRSTPNLFSLSSQGVIITGGARGLGLCVAIALLEADASAVYCLDVLPSPDEVEWPKAENIAKEKGSKIIYRKLDITDSGAVEKVVKGIYEENDSEGGITMSRFFGAAGIQHMCPAVDMKESDFRRVMDINVTGEVSPCEDEGGADCRHVPYDSSYCERNDKEGD